MTLTNLLEFIISNCENEILMDFSDTYDERLVI